MLRQQETGEHSFAGIGIDVRLERQQRLGLVVAQPNSLIQRVISTKEKKTRGGWGVYL